jgi:uncharacterized protein (TIGR01777 family)
MTDPATAHPEAPNKSLRVAITGASGFVGRHLTTFLQAQGHRVAPIGRATAGATWNPDTGEIDATLLSDTDALIHLAGSNIAEGRWTAARKRAIYSSRVDATRRLCECIARAKGKPKTLVCASASGFYGERGDAIVDESTGPGGGFLAEVCQGWERACDPARNAGVRVVHARFGVILGPGGGALSAMLPFYRWGLGGRLGRGSQWLSWIALDDALSAIAALLQDETLAGPVNLVAPNPIRQADFARCLARILRRPCLGPMPKFAVKMLFGQQGVELFLTSIRVEPASLKKIGFCFAFPDLEEALRRALGGPGGL